MTERPRRIPTLVLDGGMGTTLEDVFHTDVASALWSAAPVDANEEAVIGAHLAFMHAGADVVLTTTYQCAFETFARAGYTRDAAARTMHKAVRLAADARRRFCTSAHARRRIRIALSLGPFGATLAPAHEFDGLYPPPYGPHARAASGDASTAFEETAEGREGERAAVDALAAFHLGRLRVYAQDAETWAALDFVAFETVPLAREVCAIRMAVRRLGAEDGVRMKPWWISAVCPGGRLPEEQSPGGARVSVREVVRLALQSEGVQDLEENQRPFGVGVNCTSMDVLGTVLEEMTSAVVEVNKRKDTPAWLVVYPNRGDVYDAVNRTWLPYIPDHGDTGWAARLWSILQPVVRRDVWQGVMVGGCCKTSPTEIEALAKEVDEAGFRNSG
ncbi:Homocysteine S-methyltransferase [Amylocystis lapponica]|nr:Homocysteine S-methyltransferase [Amylocystis lapponica]